MNSNIDITSLFLQILSLQILFQDYNNSDLMNELQNQDMNYLQKIIEQNEEIKKSIQEILQNVVKNENIVTQQVDIFGNTNNKPFKERG